MARRYELKTRRAPARKRKVTNEKVENKKKKFNGFNTGYKDKNGRVILVGDKVFNDKYKNSKVKEKKVCIVKFEEYADGEQYGVDTHFGIFIFGVEMKTLPDAIKEGWYKIK